jgi:hypothetical protein
MRLVTINILAFIAGVSCGCGGTHDESGLAVHSPRRSTTVPPLTEREQRRWWADYLTAMANRRTSGHILSEAIPGTKLNKWYAIQFEPQAESPEPNWQPLFVIVWEAEDVGPTAFDPVRRSTLRVNGHVLQLPSAKRAVYSLQSDYSVKEVSLTTREMVRLFSHITQLEKRIDKRLAAIVQHVERDDPGCQTMVSAELDELRLFPPDDSWKRVDKYLKVVEPHGVSAPKMTPSPSQTTDDASRKEQDSHSPPTNKNEQK